MDRSASPTIPNKGITRPRFGKGKRGVLVNLGNLIERPRVS
jgi:hypothetical protein